MCRWWKPPPGNGMHLQVVLTCSSVNCAKRRAAAVQISARGWRDSIPTTLPRTSDAGPVSCLPPRVCGTSAVQQIG